MIREEAIKELKEDIELYIPLHGTIDDVDRDLPDGRLITALEMGIKALEQEPCDVFDKYGNYKYPNDVELTKPNTATSMPCEDAISRQAAIEALIDLCKHYTPTKSVNHPHMDFVIEALQNLPSVNPQPCEDAISRSDMLDAVGHGTTYTSEELQRIIKGLPSVNPQPKIGHWIDIMVGDMPAQACDRCNVFFPLAYTGGGHHYCPNCGAKMIEPQESEEVWN